MTGPVLAPFWRGFGAQLHLRCLWKQQALRREELSALGFDAASARSVHWPDSGPSPCARTGSSAPTEPPNQPAVELPTEPAVEPAGAGAVTSPGGWWRQPGSQRGRNTRCRRTGGSGLRRAHRCSGASVRSRWHMAACGGPRFVRGTRRRGIDDPRRPDAEPVASPSPARDLPSEHHDLDGETDG